MKTEEITKRHQRCEKAEFAKRAARKLKRATLHKVASAPGQPSPSRPVRDTKTGITYPSVNAAAKATGRDSSHLRQVLRGLYSNNTGLEFVSDAESFDSGI
jgi:hypothetical protein